jgi:hypothetical protein
MSEQKTLLSIIEIGGYPDFSNLYQQAGYEVIKINMMRKALAFLKTNHPNVIVAEFIFGPKYSFVISNVDSLFALVAGKYPDTQLILFVHQAEDHHLEKLRQRYTNKIKLESLYYPIQPQQLQNSIMPAY